MAKETFSVNYGKHNVSMILSNVKYIKNIEIFLVENIIAIYYESEGKSPSKYIKDVQIKYLKQTLNSMNAFFLLLVMSSV